MDVAPENRKKAAAVALLMLSVGVCGLAYALNNVWTISHSGQVLATGIEVFWDSNLTQPCTHIDWPQMPPGESYSYTLWLHNKGSTNVTVSMTTSDWSPSEMQSFITVTMLPSNPSLNAGTILQISLTETIDTQVQALNGTNYAYNTIFTGHEY